MEIIDKIINTLDRIETELDYQISNQDIDYEKNIIACNISRDVVYIEIIYHDELAIYINGKQIGNRIEHLYSFYVAEKYE